LIYSEVSYLSKTNTEFVCGKNFVLKENKKSKIVLTNTKDKINHLTLRKKMKFIYLYDWTIHAKPFMKEKCIKVTLIVSGFDLQGEPTKLFLTVLEPRKLKP